MQNTAYASHDDHQMQKMKGEGIMTAEDIRSVLEELAAGNTTVDAALLALRKEPFSIWATPRSTIIARCAKALLK